MIWNPLHPAAMVRENCEGNVEIAMKSTPGMRRKRIIVVDDDRDIIESLHMILSSSGYDVLEAESRKECLQLLEACQPDAIILDIMMETVSDGLNLRRELRSHPWYHSIPIIVVTSIHEHTGFPLHDTGDPGDEILRKPVEPAVLLDRIRRVFT